MKYFDNIILGAGASGMMCAISSKCQRLAIIDNVNKPAKKILVTGNGRCNFTNLNILNMQKDYYNQDISKYLSKFGVNETLKFFNSLGLEYFSDNEKRVYPFSNSAKSVVEIMTNKLSEKNVSLFLEHSILNVQKQNELFFIDTDKESFTCKKLVIALGGNAIKESFEKLGVLVKEFVPSLCAIKTESTHFLSGQRVEDVLVTATNNLGNTKSEYGEVLFKDSGLSGIVIFNLSTIFSRTNSFKGELKLDLMPRIDVKTLREKLKLRRNLNVKVCLFFDGLFISQIGREILNRTQINADKISKDLTDEEIEKFVQTIKNLKFKVVSAYDNNQVYSGGVRLDDLTDNLESKRTSGLYFAGEICDVDGLCGGYNLQWAWTSGHIVGEQL